MDKLKPLIRHHYWICFAFAVIFTVVGWWLASGKLAEATTARRTAVDDSFSKAAEGGDAPNQNWIAAARKVNESDRKAYEESSQSLWQRQKVARIWHNALQQEMQNVPYNGTVTSASTRRKWGANYGEQIDELLKIVNPFEMKDGTGLVVVNKQRITHKKYDSWKYKPPTSDEIWKNQEDIWLLKSLLTSLSRVNTGASRITDASLREIIALRLRGGDREYKPSAGGMGGAMGGMGGMGFGGGAGAMSGGDMMEAMGAMGAMGGGMGGMEGMMGGGGPGGPPRTGPWTAFEGSVSADLLTEEFGPAGGGTMGGMMGAMMGGEGADDAGGMPGMGGFGGGFGGMGGAASAVEAKRYVDEGDSLGYKTRAFFLHVRVKEDQVPRLLAELTDSDFPVEIVRVDLKTFGSGSRGGAGGVRGGMFTGMEGGDGYADSAMGMDMAVGGSEYGPDAAGAAYGLPGDDTGYSDPAMGMAMGMGDSAMDLGGAGYGAPGDDQYGGMPYGAGAYGGDGYGMAGQGMQQQTGKQALAAAMSDPMLVEVRIGGLMTLYQSNEESVAESATEAAASQEAASSPGVAEPAIETPDTEATGSAASGTEPPAVDGDIPVTDPVPGDSALPSSPDSGVPNGETLNDGVPSEDVSAETNAIDQSSPTKSDDPSVGDGSPNSDN